ncbi:LamG domain-containing protein [Flavobacteriaceae bacterium]|nr:LamG domain-containing protein [Flavobacteriaceae bacterium]
MRIGIGNTIPERSNLPGQSGGGVVVPLVLSYSSNAFCANASDPTPTVTGNVGAGTFSSTAGLVFVDSGSNTGSSTGVIDISASTPSATPYVITYTDTDSATATFNLTLNALDNAGFSYSESSYAQNFPDPTPTITGLTGGTFSGTTGLVIDSSTGVIDLDASTIASHTVTYDTTSSGSSVCPNTSTQTINIVAELAQVGNVYSMEFDTLTNESVSAGNTLTNGFSQLSISLWANFASVPTTRVLGLASKDDTNQRSFDFRYIQNTGVNFLVSTDGVNSGQTAYYPKASINAGQWYHFVGVYDGSNVLLYVNGALFDGTSTLTGSLQNTTSEFFIGKRGFSTTNTGFDGKLDEVAVFNTALTAQEVKSIYLATGIVSGASKTADLNDLTTPPVKWYRMGD